MFHNIVRCGEQEQSSKLAFSLTGAFSSVPAPTLCLGWGAALSLNMQVSLPASSEWEINYFITLYFEF